MTILADDDVVMHGDAERRRTFRDCPGHVDVGTRRRRVTRGMVVYLSSDSA